MHDESSLPRRSEERHPTRRAVLSCLRGRALAAGEIARLLGVKKSTLSHHLRVLAEERRVTCRPEGPLRIYGIATAADRASPLLPGLPRESAFAATFRRVAHERGGEHYLAR